MAVCCFFSCVSRLSVALVGPGLAVLQCRLDRVALTWWWPSRSLLPRAEVTGVCHCAYLGGRSNGASKSRNFRRNCILTSVGSSCLQELKRWLSD